MLTEYIECALSKAVFEKFEDGTYCGTIPPCVGIIAFGSTLYVCQKELRSSLEDWLMAKFRHGQRIPVIEGVDLNVEAPEKISTRG